MKTRPTLSETLTALIDGVNPDHPDLIIQDAEISLPLLVRMEYGRDGPIFRAQPPFSAFRSGVEPVAHMAHIRMHQTVIPEADPSTSDPPNSAG